MKKRLLAFCLLIAMMVGLMIPAEEKQVFADSEEMNIYVFYLGDSDVKGECVLLESKGEYLLMDVGSAEHVPTILEKLNDMGIIKVSVYLSHLHLDHTGGSQTTGIMDGLDQLYTDDTVIDKLYLPAPELSQYSKSNPARYKKLTGYASDITDIVYLNVGDTIQVGDVTGEIIGPVEDYSKRPESYAVGSDGKPTSSAYTNYENDCSLVSVWTCGTTKYFTAGDCLQKEASALVQKYGSSAGGKLDCDIMKLNHHGTGTGNTRELINAISPSYSFADNYSYAGVNSETGKWRVYNSITRASDYGITYMSATEKETLIYHVVNDQISLYRGDSVEDGTRQKGFVFVKGGDGKNITTQTYYMYSDGTLAREFRYINGKAYQFDEAGRMVRGKYKNGVYQGWRTDTVGRRYYLLNADKTLAQIVFGFQYLGQNYYYFDDNGYLVKNTGDDPEMELDGGLYIVDENGRILFDDWYTVNEDQVDEAVYYYDHSGHPVSNCFRTIDGSLYYFDASGKLYKGQYESGEAELVTIDGAFYLIKKDGKIIRNRCVSQDDGIYYAGNDGQVALGQFVEINGETSYFGVSGTMLSGRILEKDGHTYYLDEDGIVAKNRMVEIDGDTYYFDSNGYRVTKTLVKYEGKYYYFGIHSNMVKNKTFKIDKVSWKAGEDGVCHRVKKE